MTNAVATQTLPPLRFLVEQDTLFEGWVPFGTIGDGYGNDRPCSYDTFGEAVNDVMEFLSDIANQIATGEREPEDDYSDEGFRIRDTDKDKIYDFYTDDNGQAKIVYPQGTEVSAAGLRTVVADK